MTSHYRVANHTATEAMVQLLNNINNFVLNFTLWELLYNCFVFKCWASIEERLTDRKTDLVSEACVHMLKKLTVYISKIVCMSDCDINKVHVLCMSVSAS